MTTENLELTLKYFLKTYIVFLFVNRIYFIISILKIVFALQMLHLLLFVLLLTERLGF